MNISAEKARLSAQSRFTVEDLHTLVSILRSPEGCDWDAEQTHVSLRSCLTNETAEVVEAIDNGDDPSLREELGDLLLQIIFHSVIAEEEGAFSLDDVVTEICKKMLFRHPHVFKGEEKPDWNVIKAAEKELRRTGKW
ncbi:MAG: nucleotide pyrophosphohydrolase [Clostridia bacterium]|nr:nucleotide pyrophosphohydrolase [Clostridia bacterium]